MYVCASIQIGPGHYSYIYGWISKLFDTAIVFEEEVPFETSRGAYRMVASIILHPSLTFSKDFSETTGPILFQFHTQAPGKGGKQVYVFRPGQMTKMAAMPICGKNLEKSSPDPLTVAL